MAYKVIVSPRAQKEIEDSIDYYSQNSINAPYHFVSALEEAYRTLENDPLTRIRYKKVRALKLRKFPYLLYFVINERTLVVRVLSCFHDKRNPKSRPRI